MDYFIRKKDQNEQARSLLLSISNLRLVHLKRHRPSTQVFGSHLLPFHRQRVSVVKLPMSHYHRHLRLTLARVNSEATWCRGASVQAPAALYAQRLIKICKYTALRLSVLFPCFPSRHLTRARVEMFTITTKLKVPLIYCL